MEMFARGSKTYVCVYYVMHVNVCIARCLCNQNHYAECRDNERQKYIGNEYART